MFHSTIKEEEVNFLKLNIKLIDGEFMTDLFVEPTIYLLHLFLDLISCHSYHCKRGIHYSQVRLNRICSDNKNFDRRSSDLEKRGLWKEVTTKIL